MKKYSIIKVGGQSENISNQDEFTDIKNVNNEKTCKETNYDYNGAGIVLYSYNNEKKKNNNMNSMGNLHDNNKKIYFLLGREAITCPLSRIDEDCVETKIYRDKLDKEGNVEVPGSIGNLLGDFGGEKIDSDNENPINTAARIFHHQTMGSFEVKDKNNNSIQLDEHRMKYELKKSTSYCFTNKKYKYVQFLVKVPYNEEIPKTFNRMMKYLNNCKEWNKINEDYKQKILKECGNKDPNMGKKKELKWFQMEKLLISNSPVVNQLRPEVRSSIVRILYKDIF